MIALYRINAPKIQEWLPVLLETYFLPELHSTVKRFLLVNKTVLLLRLTRFLIIITAVDKETNSFFFEVECRGDTYQQEVVLHT